MDPIVEPESSSAALAAGVFVPCPPFTSALLFDVEEFTACVVVFVGVVLLLSVVVPF